MTDLKSSSTTSSTDEADRALKSKHRAMWASGDYPALAHDLIWSLGPRLVEAVDIRPGERVLDIAAGTGNAAIPAALRGASVVATDLTPELFDAGRRHAREAGAELEWREADAEALPFSDGEFDVAISSIGIMFAPHHERSSAELLRVTRSGGRIGLLSWTPSGLVGQMFAAMKPFNAPPPPGAQPAPLWGDEQHVRGLLGDAVTDVHAVRDTVRVDRFASGVEFRQHFASHYGPVIAVYNRNADDPEKLAALDAALDAVGDAVLEDDGGMRWEYLLLTATVR
ncbi:methyltransferase family protein [Diaminobutyricimonas aerilata]|uniref:Methyltransferase family protein n=1 Tax=Diaminobutyricimonas aerilata TaxID=1162967 RepID=A0A2M9CG85_9MICO|nr:class I SAM-dependent methyltransferase [Diaminobutyricimonas aerilata]PJJ70941.1 methyltransferase family protein [Diaminobutyricimonas aerilata]